MKNNKVILTTLAPASHRTSEENLGLGYLKSSLTANGYDVIIIDGWLNKYNTEEVYNLIKKESNVLFVGTSSYMSNTKPTIELIQKLKKDNYKIASGGFGPTFYPKEYLKNGTDYVISGEGETSIVKLANALKDEKKLETIEGLIYEDRQVIKINAPAILEDLDAFSFPARDTMNLVVSKKSTVNMITSRGCTGNCEFCSVIAFFDKCKGKRWRGRSITNIVDEIESLVKNGITDIKMVDDSFIDGTRDLNWCIKFADEIEKRNIKFKLRGQIRADKITDQILFHLKRAGFYSFACGIENGSEDVLKRMNKTASLKDNKRALELFKKYDYIVQMGYILFDKDTTLKELWDNYYFLKENIFAITKGIFSEMYSAEGTNLNTKLKENDMLNESSFLEGNNSYQIFDNEVRLIYNYLKKWHKSHSYIYDMTIDPLVAPKVISEEARQKLIACALKLKKMDLLIFKKILIEKNNLNFDLEFETEMLRRSEFYKENYKIVKEIYNIENLKYDAEKNPFIK